ncbi:hypothetical protein MKK63_04220 [Methylobacterium sp. J-088]|uniref:hypothetical protein n=1 Tax=Methylobacterium sp. J-088 TaxID=2836664 RepID=UPI001FB97D5B|nr:hypothetical protein [Methylobacterium sp. J-088]MCJ2061906.1 hypothetical protein [Methylobacterium sp. J-088]
MPHGCKIRAADGRLAISGASVRFQASASPEPILARLTGIDRMTGRGHLHGMRRWAEPLTVIIVFAIVMTAIGWVLGATVPSVDAWLVERIGKAGVWAALGLVIVVGAIATYRSSKLGEGR